MGMSLLNIVSLGLWAGWGASCQCIFAGILSQTIFGFPLHTVARKRWLHEINSYHTDPLPSILEYVNWMLCVWLKTEVWPYTFEHE